MPSRAALGAEGRSGHPAVDGDIGWAHVGAAEPPLAACGAGCTWSTFGGAIDDGETPWHAAVRETSEEVDGIDVRLGVVAAELEVPCEHGCGWSYTTFAVRVLNTGTGCLPSAQIAPGRSAWETAGLAWVLADRVAEHPGLHPGLRAAWPRLRVPSLTRATRRPSGVVPARCPGRRCRGLTRC